MPFVNDTFNISDNHQNRSQAPIRTINDGQGQGDTLTIAVDLWQPQGGQGDDWPAFDCQMLLFGRGAEIFLENFGPGDAVHVRGDLRSRVNENGYVDRSIYNADWSFIPNDRSGGQTQQSGPQNDPVQNQSTPNNMRTGPQGGAQTRQGGDARPPADAPGPSQGTDSAPAPSRP